MEKIIFIIGTCAILLGCASAVDKRTSNDVLDYQQQVTISEARIALYEQSIDECISSIERIREQSESAETTIDECIQLFGEYQQRVEQLICYYNDLRREIEARNTYTNNIDRDSAD